MSEEQSHPMIPIEGIAGSATVAHLEKALTSQHLERSLTTSHLGQSLPSAPPVAPVPAPQPPTTPAGSSEADRTK